jgi:hypothetical protein
MYSTLPISAPTQPRKSPARSGRGPCHVRRCWSMHAGPFREAICVRLPFPGVTEISSFRRANIMIAPIYSWHSRVRYSSSAHLRYPTEHGSECFGTFIPPPPPSVYSIIDFLDSTASQRQRRSRYCSLPLLSIVNDSTLFETFSHQQQSYSHASVLVDTSAPVQISALYTHIYMWSIQFLALRVPGRLYTPPSKPMSTPRSLTVRPMAHKY